MGGEMGASSGGVGGGGGETEGGTAGKTMTRRKGRVSRRVRVCGGSVRVCLSVCVVVFVGDVVAVVSAGVDSHVVIQQ